MSAPQTFYCLWQDKQIRETLFEHLSNKDICSVRLANSACCNVVTKRLFLRTQVTFTANTFTKASRVQALSRIGHHIEHLTFYFPHSEATFLPPLIHPLTGREITFLYTPHTSMGSVLTRPKYCNSELGDVLTQQYPPLFHAATNVPSFLNALKHIPNMRHLTIKCPGQEPSERYRRSIVDYALISLRISVERAPLEKLTKLSLSGVHPAAFNYIRHVPGFGTVPSAARRWRQIRKLYMSVDAWDFYGPAPGLDHLKILDDYLRFMAPQLEKFSFTWLCESDSSSSNSAEKFQKGPCPIALSGDPLFAPLPPKDGSKKLFNEVTGPMSPLPPRPQREPMHFPRLRCLTVRNTTMNGPQLRDLVERHKDTVREFDFENVALVDGDSWSDAFAPVLEQVSATGNEMWSRYSYGGTRLSSNGSCHESSHGKSNRSDNNSNTDISDRRSIRLETPPQPVAAVSSDDIVLSSPSAAVAAVSQTLLDMDMEGLEGYLGLSQELPFLNCVPSENSWREDSHRSWTPPTIHEEEGEGDEDSNNDVNGKKKMHDFEADAASEIAAAHEASLQFTTRLKKRRIRRRRKHRGSEDNGDESDRESRGARSRSRHRHHHRHDHRHERHEHHERRARSPSPPPPPRSAGSISVMSSSSSTSSPSSSFRRICRKASSASTRSASASASVVAHSSATPPPLALRAHPFDRSAPLPVGAADDNPKDHNSNMVRPSTPPETTESAAVAALSISAPILDADPMPVLLQPTVYDPAAMTAAVTGMDTLAGTATTANDMSPIQLQIEQEEADRRRQEMADDAEARASALKKAKQAVLVKLSREFQRRIGRETAQRSAAATAAMAAMSLSLPTANNNNSSDAASVQSTSTWRERLFGVEPLHMPFRSGTSSMAVGSDYHRSMESNSAVVPLIFSRA